MRKATLGLMAIFGLVASPGIVEAQFPGGLTLDVRGGVGVPTGDLGDDELMGAETGFGFGATVGLNVLPMVGVYGGYSRFMFPVESESLTEAQNEAEFVDSGFNGGVKLMVPATILGGLNPYLQGGVVYRELELDVEGDVVDVESDSESAWGYEIGAGLAFPLGQVISVTPGVRYVSYSPDAAGGEADGPDISYVAADIGLSIRF
ncbi:MAG TPA: outer membrane beta-barrel protein [Longimicrobiaceae bacterium]|nr:outer membrane beta-barrel protein [Longimicrobiaceae bacterium]